MWKYTLSSTAVIVALLLNESVMADPCGPGFGDPCAIGNGDADVKIWRFDHGCPAEVEPSQDVFFGTSNDIGCLDVTAPRSIGTYYKENLRCSYFGYADDKCSEPSAWVAQSEGQRNACEEVNLVPDTAINSVRVVCSIDN